MKSRFIALIILIALATSQARARPVSYPGGITLMQRHNFLFDSTHIHYSPSAKYSLGYRFEYFRHEPAYSHSIQLNNLLHRWNSQNYQANLYLKSGLGIIHNSSELSQLLYSGLATDWETRRLFASYSNRFYWGDNVFNYINNSFRLGVAPYIADYGGLHTWFMTQFDINPITNNEFLVTPLIRLFKSVYMLEVGYSFGSDSDSMLANFIWRF